MYTCKTWGITLGSFVFVFKIFPKTRMLIQIAFLYSCFLQKFGLWLSDVEPSRTLNAAFYFSFPNTVQMLLYHEYKFHEKINPLTSVRKTDIRW